ncbi:MAG: SprT-like domain-containing protein [Oscillospiraceae bacterium]
MDNASLKPVIAELEGLFSKFNKAFFEGKLEQPMITVSPDHTRGAYGWCTSWKAWQDGSKEGGFYEINLCAEYLNRPFEETCGTLIHEMVHLWNLQNGVQDTSRGGSYHNRKFKEAAEQHGLTVEKGEKYGWHKTTLAPATLTFVQSLGKNGFSLVRPRVNTLKGSKKSSSSRKYVCPCCGAIIRATKEVNVICGDCEVPFVEDEA